MGIVAHVDAGKTTLTERLLYAAGVIDAIGSVDAGTTQTDSMALERERGITIRAAVVAFTLDGLAVNLIDTPGHPDFIAEVERSLAVLDGAVLVVSAVEGVQSQTVVLMRALTRLRVPTLILVNKIDRAGADPERVLAAIRDRLVPHPIPMGTVHRPGTRGASFRAYERADEAFAATVLGELPDDDALLAAYVDNGRSNPSADELCGRLAAGTAGAEIHPVFFGSAATGAGIEALRGAFITLLPSATGDPAAPVAGSVFKVDRSSSGEKVAYLRIFAGTVHTRDRLRYGVGRESTVTAVQVISGGSPVDRGAVEAGQIAKVLGLREVQVGDAVGAVRSHRAAVVFAPPTLETAVVPTDSAQKGALFAALATLAEQDPLINVRQDDLRQELFVSLYGDVQKEVLAATLAAESGIAVEFRETTVLCIERPVGVGHAVEWIGASSNPFLATIGLTLGPGPVGSGLDLRLAVELNTIPLYVYGTVDAFCRAMTDYVRGTLQQGLSGWQVTDTVVTVTDTGYSSPGTGSGDFRKLTPLPVMSALQQAGTAVCEPIHHVRLDAPADTLSALLGAVARHRGVPIATSVSARYAAVDADIPAAELQHLRRELHGRTHGEGVLEAVFDRYQPVVGAAPSRPRSDLNPLNRKEYLLHLLRRV